MEKIVDVQINKTNALITLGSMYRSAADAIKEYVSNALDEWAIARSEGRGEEQCRVGFTLEKKAITIDYNAPGMDAEGFENALRHVVDSAKRGSSIPQIGRLGIGLWAFNQVGTKATFLSKRSAESPTLKVILSRDSAEAQIADPGPGEERSKPGMTIEITGLFQDPTRRYGPLSQARLKHVLADRFDVYLRTGQLTDHHQDGQGRLRGDTGPAGSCRRSGLSSRRCTFPASPTRSSGPASGSTLRDRAGWQCATRVS